MNKGERARGGERGSIRGRQEDKEDVCAGVCVVCEIGERGGKDGDCCVCVCVNGYTETRRLWFELKTEITKTAGF